MSRILLTLTLVSFFIACLHESPPTQLRGEITRSGVHFIVTECSTRRTYELKLVPAAHVRLARDVSRVEAASGGPVLVEIGGKILPATSGTLADALFDVHQQYDVRPGACG